VGETIAAIVEAHRSGASSPEATVARTYARIRAHGDPAIFITLRAEADALAEAAALTAKGGTDLQLYGVPVAVKDNIDVAGLPTTAACPAFAYDPGKDATCVARLRRAGAIVIGKTNLDQFATGLVGVRSPYGTPRNLFDPSLIPGGSSAGSAIAVGAGLVPLALGTDTAGSGRVPAGLSNIVGLKPSLGLVSTAGVVPACRTLDCVSVFALTVDDAFAALAAMAGPDPADPYSRPRPLGAPEAVPAGLRIGVPMPGQRLFFGDKASAAAYEVALADLAGLGAAIVEIDIEPFYETARLLYDGPWVAERYISVRSLIASAPEAMHPVTRQIILGGAHPGAIDRQRLDQAAHHPERPFERPDRPEQRRLVVLEVALVGQREALEGGEHPGQLPDDAGSAAPDQLGRVGVLLVGHHRAAGRESVGDAHEPEARVRPPGDLLGQPAEVDHPERHGGEDLDDEVAIADRVERVRGDAVEAELRGRALAIERVARTRERAGQSHGPDLLAGRCGSRRHLQVPTGDEHR